MQHIIMQRSGGEIGDGSTNNNNNVQRQPISPEQVQNWICQLEQWTTTFYSSPNLSNSPLWIEAEQKLIQFQKINDPLELCTEIIKKTRNSLVLYQATMCLKNAVANDFKKFDLDDLFKLFQFLCEFLFAQALENEMSVNETVALICAMILKRIASERHSSMTAIAMIRQNSPRTDKQADQIAQVLATLCNHIKDPNENLSKRIASALIINSLLLECQMTNRSTLLGIRVWKHLNARRLIETHLKSITETCLATINWAFTSNLLNPANQTREVQILFHLVGILIQCIEYSLSFNSNDTGYASGGDRVLRVLQIRSLNMLPQVGEHEQRLKNLREWYDLVMTPSVVQFLFHLYSTVKSMIGCTPGWTWPDYLLKNCLNCLYYLSDVHNAVNIERDETYADFVGNLMLGAVKIMDSDLRGIDDSFQVACLITSISMHTSETKDSITGIKAEYFIPFIDAAQRFTCKVFALVASTTSSDEEEEEEKTVDALLDFWYHLFRNIEAEIRYSSTPKITPEGLKAYSRVIVENYISYHLHKPLGQMTPKTDREQLEVDLDFADEQDDNNIHAQQLVSFGMIARFDALHSAQILITLLATRVGHYEALLTQYIDTKPTPDGIQDWEFINDDIHWLLLFLQHYLTQTGYGETGFMCSEILAASLNYKADVQKTLKGFENCDYCSTEVDPIVRLMLITLKLCQIEIKVCQSGKVEWLSTQTNCTLTGLLSRFCLTYLFPKESEYSEISENMNYCFGQDSPTADKFIKFIIEHTCWVILRMNSNPQVLSKNFQFLIQVISVHPQVKEMLENAEEEVDVFKALSKQLKPDKLSAYHPELLKHVMKLFSKCGDTEEWDMLIGLFNTKWSTILNYIQNREHQNEMVSTKFQEFCDFAIAVCEACIEETSQQLFDNLLVPISKTLPAVLIEFKNFDNVFIKVFELLYYIVKQPMVNIVVWNSETAQEFYKNCNAIIDVYASIAISKTNRGHEEEDCQDIIGVLNFCHEVMKRDWGNNSSEAHDNVVKNAMEKMSVIIKPQYLQFPRLRTMYYRLLVYLVDEDERLVNLNESLLNTIVSSIILALESRFDKDVDQHVYTIIGIVCRSMYNEKGEEVYDRLRKAMLPVLPALFKWSIIQGACNLNTDSAETVAPAFFSLRCCYTDLYHSLVKDLIDKQEDPFVQTKVKQLFENLEAKVHKFTLNRSACREFNTLFVPFLAELHNYIAIR